MSYLLPYYNNIYLSHPGNASLPGRPGEPGVPGEPGITVLMVSQALKESLGSMDGQDYADWMDRREKEDWKDRREKEDWKDCQVCHEKTTFCICESKDADQLRCNKYMSCVE